MPREGSPLSRDSVYRSARGYIDNTYTSGSLKLQENASPVELDREREKERERESGSRPSFAKPVCPSVRPSVHSFVRSFVRYGAGGWNSGVSQRGAHRRASALFSPRETKRRAANLV